MAVIALAAVLVGLVISSAWLVSTIRHDGYGTRPAPASRAGWGQTTMPSAPYAAQLSR